MNLLYEYNPQKDFYTSIVKRGESDLKYIDFGLLKFSETGSWGETVTNEEVALILLRGECELKITHDSGEIKQVIGPRPNVFREKAYAAYIPKDSKYEIRAEGPEMAVCKAPSELNAEPAIITPEQVKVSCPFDNPFRKLCQTDKKS